MTVEVALTKLVGMAAAVVLAIDRLVKDIDSGSVTSCKVGVELTISIVVDDTKVMVVGISIVIVVSGSITLVDVNGTTVVPSAISVDVVMTMEMSVFELPRVFSTLDKVDMKETEVTGDVDDGKSISLTDIPLPSSAIIPAVSGQVAVQLRSKSRQ